MSSNQTERIFYIVISALVWVYILIRSIYSPVVHDEAETFYIYIQSENFLPPHSYLVANNHLLNSFLTFLSWKVFGTSLWALRLPNVLSAIVFFIYVFKLGNLLNNKTNKWVFILSMFFTHYIIEFFGYTRGYGLSVAFNLAAIYHLITFFKSRSSKDTFCVSLFSILALAANLALINTFVLIHTLLILFNVISYLTSKDGKLIKNFLVQAIVSIPPFIYLLNYILLLKSVGSLNLGLAGNFFNATLGTLSNMLFKTEPMIFQYATSLVLIISIIILLYVSVKKTDWALQNVNKLIFPLLFFGNIVMSILLSLLFGMNYPEDRTAMYFVPLFIGSTVFIADLEIKGNRVYKYILFIPLVLSVFHFATVANLNFSSYTPNYRIPEKYYNFVYEETKKREIPPVVETYKEHRTEWYFTNQVKSAIVSPLAHQVFPSSCFEYVISDEIDFPDWKKGYESIMYDKQSKKHLLKRKKDLDLVLIDSAKVSMDNENNGMYFNLYQSKSPQKLLNNIQFVVDLKIESHINPFQAAIIAKANAPDHPSARASSLELERIRPFWDSENNSCKFSLTLAKIPENTNEILIFLFNKKEVPFKIIEAKTYVYTYN